MRVSVALCTFNGQRHLPDQLRSLADQTRLPDELVVCDDHSADATVRVLDEFATRAPFTVRVLRNDTTIGTTANFERAISLCAGDLILLCDQDDVWAREKVARFGAQFADHPDTGLVASDLDVIDATGVSLGRRVWQSLGFTRAEQAQVRAGQGPRVWLRYNTLTGAALAFRADLRAALLPIPAGWVHDAWIAFVAGAVAPVRLLAEPLTRYRVHPEQQIGAAARTIRYQFDRARGKSAAEFAGVAARFAAAADRLAALGAAVRDPELLPRVRDKVALARLQQRLREGGRLRRIVPALRTLFAGRYHRYARGWKSFAADLMF
jgi:glycosyltransferase involved in cell wall biosynthesis